MTENIEVKKMFVCPICGHNEVMTTYAEAINKVSDIMDVTSDFDIYDASHLLAKMFNADRDTIANEIMKYRVQKANKK